MIRTHLGMGSMICLPDAQLARFVDKQKYEPTSNPSCLIFYFLEGDVGEGRNNSYLPA